MPASDTTPIRRPRAKAIAAGACFGVLTALAFPPTGLWPLSLLALVPLLLIAQHLRAKPLTAAAWTAIGTLPLWWLLHQWTAAISPAAAYSIAVGMACFIALFVFLLASALRRDLRPAWLVAPVLWVGVEVFRGELVVGGYAWYLAAHPLINAPAMLFTWPASIAGQYAVSFLVALVGVAIVALMRRRARTPEFVIPAAIALLWPIVGLVWPASPAAGRDLNVAVVQTNMAQDVGSLWTGADRVKDWEALRDLIVRAGDGTEAEIIVTPESALPAMTLDADSIEVERERRLYYEVDADGVPIRLAVTAFAEELFIIQRALGIPIVANALGYTNLRIVRAPAGGLDYEADAIFNSMYLIQDGAAAARYDKLRLTPFGEEIPYARSVPWLVDFFVSMAAAPVQLRLAPGDDPGVILEARTPVGPVRLASPVCYEATDTAVCRRLVYADGQRRADLLVNGTNDGWFGPSTAGREAHLLGARWRCVELATPMARAANTGISAIIDAQGRVLARAEPNAQAILASPVRLPSAASPYAFVGGTVHFTVALAALVVAVLALRPARSSEKTS